MSKGGSTSSTVAVPEYIEDAARRNLTEADKIRRLGFIPEYGPTVAAFTPMQEAAFQGTAQAAGAFGLPGGGMSMQDISGGMPEPTTYAGGVRGYSSLPIYEQALEAFGQARPGQKRYAESFFIDPVTGLPGSNMQAPVDYTVASTPGDLGGIGAGGGVATGGGAGGDSAYFPETITGTPTAPTDGTVYTSTDYAGSEAPYTIVTPTDVRPPGYIDNTPSTFTEQRQYYDSSPMLPGGPAVIQYDDGTSIDLGYDLGPSVAGGRGTIVPAQPTYTAQPTQEQLDYAKTSLDPFGGAGPDVTSGPIAGLVSGGGADGVGNFGQVGDFFGDLLGGLNVTGPPVENKVTSYSHSTDNDKPAGPGDSGWEQDRYLEALQSGGTGIIYKDDRREVYLDGVLIGKPKRAETAEKMLREAKEEKAAASQPSTLSADTSTSAGMEVRALPNGTEYFVDAAGNFAGLK